MVVVRSIARHAPAALLFTALTSVLAYPILISLGSAVAGWEGDNLYYVRSIWWWKHALFDLRISPFFDPTAYYPVGQQTGRSELTAANTVLALPLTLTFGPIVAYNSLLIFSFVATGFFTYLWIERLTGRRSAGLLAGTVAAFLPFRFAHLPGHLPQVATQWVPLALYSFELFLERQTLRRAALLGLAVALVTLGCWYYAYALALMLPIYVLLRARAERGVWRRPAWWRGVLAAAAVALMVVAPFLLQMFRLYDAGQLHRSLGEMDEWSLNPYEFFVPNPRHPVWGDPSLNDALPMRRRAHWVEHGVALGMVAVLSALVGVVSGRPRRSVAALSGVWLASYLVALGPTLHYHDRQVRVDVPAPLAAAAAKALAVGGLGPQTLPEGFLQAHDLPVPLPSLALYMFVPFTSGMRVMARFGMWTGLMTAGLAGWGLLKLVEIGERRFGPTARRTIPGALIAAVAFESLAVIPMLAVVPRPVDLWLAKRPGDPVVVELPVAQGGRRYQNYWATTRQGADLFGWRGDSFPPPVELERRTALEGFPSASSLQFLKASAATHVLVSPEQIPGWDDASQSTEFANTLRLEAVVGDVHVYRVVR
jgi:hypothetical protein